MKKLLLLCGLFAAGLSAQTRIAPDCVITFTFTAATAATPANTCGENTQGIVDWTLVYSNYNFSALSIVVQSAPDAGGTPGTWGTFAGTVNVGTNPSTSTTSAYVRLTGYNPWNRVYLTSVTGTGSITGVLYGCRQPGCSQSAASGGGGGITLTGTTDQIALSIDPCTSTDSCTVALANNTVLPGNPSTPGTFSTGVGSGATGAVDMVGKTSGATSTVTVDDNNTATQVNLPNDGTSGLYLATSPSPTPAAGCAEYNGTGTQIASTGSPCGSGGGTAGGGVLGYSASALTLPTAGTTFLAPVGGAQASTTEANVTANAPAAAAISNMYVTLSVAPGAGNTAAFTFRDAGSSTALTCTISGASATSCQDITHSFTPTVGDALSIQVVTTGTVVIAPVVKIIAEYGVTGGGGGGGSTRGLFASRPSCSTSGSSYFATDVPIISECNASSWADWAYGRNVTLPSAVSFTTVLNSAVINTNGVAQINAVGGNNAYGEDLALPSTPYTLYLGFRCGIISSGGYCGLYIRNSTGTTIVTYAFQALGPNDANFQVAHFSNYTGFTGGVQDFSTATVNQGIVDNYIAIHDDGTNFTFFICTDRFNCSASLFSESRTANLTSPGFLGWFATGNANATDQINMVVFDFTVTQP